MFKRRKLKVLTHYAYFMDSEDKDQYMFIKCLNICDNPLVISTIYMREDHGDSPDTIKEDEKWMRDAGLPIRVLPYQLFECWINVKNIQMFEEPLKAVRVILSNGKVFKSSPNYWVQPYGKIG